MPKVFLPAKYFETRVIIKNPEEARKKIINLGGKKIKDSAYRDSVFQPRGINWDLNKKNLKLRVFEDKKVKRVAELKYHPAGFEGDVKKSLVFFDAVMGSPKDALKILRDWNFEELFAYRRTAEIYEIGDQIVSLENIEKLGYQLEVEGDNIKEVNELVEKLGFGGEIIKKSLPEYFRLKLLKRK